MLYLFYSYGKEVKELNEWMLIPSLLKIGDSGNLNWQFWWVLWNLSDLIGEKMALKAGIHVQSLRKKDKWSKCTQTTIRVVKHYLHFDLVWRMNY